jgi:hypothetical protein
MERIVMTKQVTICEEDVQECEAEESREDILQAINTPEPAPPSSPVQQPMKQRVNNLVQCELCNKFVTKKTLNYSHAKTCKGNPENQVKQKTPEEPEPIQEALPEPFQQFVPPQYGATQYIRPTYQQLKMDQRRAHLEGIN